MGIVERYLLQLNTLKRRFRWSAAFLTVLSLLVVLAVFWNLRQTGIAIANDACCGMEEHQHTEECNPEKVLICGMDEDEPAEETTEQPTEETTEDSAEQPSDGHVHGDECYKITYLCDFEEHIHDFSCFSDLTADLEDWSVWNSVIPELTGQISEDIVLVAQSQLGCTESTLNFQLADDGITQNGITRYGQWYGNPYGPWSNMFTAFCLRYAGLSNVPIHSGAEKMQQDWQAANLYRYAGGYEPVSGDIVFLDKNQNGIPEATGVVIQYFDFILTVIEGDVDNAVVQTQYRIDDPAITGYGITNAGNRLMMFAAGANTSSVTIGQTVNYPNTAGTFILYATEGAVSYAIDGNGDAVPIQISNGNITADIADPSMLYWIFTGSRNAYTIKNAATGKYLYPRNGNLLNATSQNLTLTGSGTGATIRAGSRNRYYYVRYSESEFGAATSGSTIYFGKTPTQYSLWLDGTNGNIMSYRGSNDTKYTVCEGAQMQLPSTWKSPTKYHYKLAGWVNIKTGEYYSPGDTITVTENTVLYADWVANTYDIGVFNSMVADTVSTKDFITTRVFDYSSLINLHSSKVTVNVSGSDHSETWSHVASGNVTYKGHETLDFSFDDQDSNGSITSLNNVNNRNKYTGGTAVYPGIYDETLGEALFGIHNLFDPETGEGVVGKHYLGTGDYLFQINNDPSSEYYGYYYYDADLNAAAYNQSDQRFYVYDYLVKASDSGSNDYSDFLPLNSAYANNNEQTVKTYTHNGVTNYSFESGYGNNNNAKANLWFGMRVDVQFGLPETPGEVGADGVNGNKDVYGNDMHFKFTGDDDVWILVDGKVALDLGGIHQAADGDINFATGKVRVNGKDAGTLQGIEAGEHTLSILYLERGGSQSNCAIYFNLAPRYALALRKEDVLSQKLLDGATFEFFHDQECKVPCELWPSRQAYKDGEQATNVFTVENGQAFIWGLNPSSTYYIREKAPPGNDPNAPAGSPLYERAKGLIKLTLDKNGLNAHSTTILEEIGKDGNKVPITPGFTIHGFRIDEGNQTAYLSITNAQSWVTEATSVYVEKVWNDDEDHTGDDVTVYLNVTEPNGTVRRLREIQLSKANDWKYVWTNLPKYIQADDGSESDIPVSYSVSEAYVPGYTAQVRELRKDEYSASVSGYGYRINNIPLDTETSLKVTKSWNHPDNDATLYEKEQITIRLLANDVDTGRAETVSLKNNWEVTFNGLPYLDAAGDPIRYTVVEIMENEEWIPAYGEIIVIENEMGNPTYETTITNHYRWTYAVELPATGGTGYPPYILIGLILISAPFVYGFRLRRRHERRTRQ